MLTHLAIDIGASSGRHIIGRLENGQIALKEMHRFENKTLQKAGHATWDTTHLYNEIIHGLQKCKALNYIPDTMGIDTWGVDYVLLDANNQIVGEAYAYRDHRTQGMDARLEKTLPFSEHFAHCGIAKQPFNTIYQLMATAKCELEKADCFLMIPDYFHFLLTGVKANEYTNASTTAMLNAKTRTWDNRLLEAANIPAHLFSAPIRLPGTTLGPLTPEVASQVGFTCQVVLPATHDTGSAYIAVPKKDDYAITLSSGTWSLLGVDNDVPILTDESRIAGFTNEGGYDGSIRLLKNIMGLWILQSIRKEWGNRVSFAQMAETAKEGAHYPHLFDANDNRFLAPASMLQTIRDSLVPPPQNDAELLYAVYHSLVACYQQAISDLEKMTAKRYTSLNIVGGGSQNKTLNEMIAKQTGLPVYAGPSEGTALGNIIVQMIATSEIASLQQARDLIARSQPIDLYH